MKYIFLKKCSRVKLKTKQFALGKNKKVVLDEGSSISQQIRRPCKRQLAVNPPWGMGLTIRIRTAGPMSRTGQTCVWECLRLRADFQDGFYVPNTHMFSRDGYVTLNQITF